MPDESLWEVFSAHSETLILGTTPVRVPNRTTLALHIVPHAVHDGFQGHTDEDLRRVIEAMPSSDWAAVCDLAGRLDLTEVLGFGLRRHPTGAALADRFGLATLDPARSLYWDVFAPFPKGANQLTGFFAAATVRKKLRWVRWTLVPTPARLRFKLNQPDLHGQALLVAYRRLWLDIATNAPAALRFVRRRAADRLTVGQASRRR